MVTKPLPVFIDAPQELIRIMLRGLVESLTRLSFSIIGQAGRSETVEQRLLPREN